MNIKEDYIRLIIRYTIPSTSQQNNFDSKLREYGFDVEEICPDEPKDKELMAYKITGLFKGTWPEFFAAWQRISVDWQIKEFMAKLS